MSNTVETHFDAELLKLASPVERVPFTSRQQIEQRVRERRPAIFTGALDHWPALHKWTPEYFQTNWGDSSLAAHETKWTGKTPYLFGQKERIAKKSFKDFIGETLKDGSYDLYVHQIDAAEVFPGSTDDLDYDSLIDVSPSAPLFRPNIWMGTPGTRSGLHFDSAENLVAVFYGAKAFMLVDPATPRLVYPFGANPTKSHIDPTHVDWARFSRLKRARIFIDVLRPGELLFLPRAWWHYFTSLQFTINATRWFYWKGNDASVGKSIWYSYVPYLFRCGPTYPLQFLFQFFWYGMLKRPFERKALSPPPQGVRLWNRLRTRGHRS
jgi:hypothetical protein